MRKKITVIPFGVNSSVTAQTMQLRILLKYLFMQGISSEVVVTVLTALLDFPQI